MTNNTVENCTIGADIINSFNVDFSNNKVQNCPTSVRIRRVGTGSCYNHVISGNIITNYTGQGVIFSSDGATLCGQSVCIGNVLTGSGGSAQGLTADSNCDRIVLLGNVTLFNSGGNPFTATNSSIDNNILS
jgi:hypothetical protein